MATPPHALITGGSGFIGSHLVDRLLGEGWRVTNVDNFDPFYDRSIKWSNVASHLDHERYRLVEADICHLRDLEHLLLDDYEVIIHLAARAGVRPSIADPLGYQEVNVGGTQSVLEFARRRGIRQFVFGSSSSVYGTNPNVPWSEEEAVLRPISPYASTKVAGELLGHTYSHLFGIRFLALRFFTVYGPRQRPDLAIHKFTRMMLRGETIPLFGDGSTRRDYTFVTDIVEGIRRAMDYEGSEYEVINLGNSQTVALIDLVRALEKQLDVEARIQHLPEQPGDVPQTWAATEKAEQLLGYRPATELTDGLSGFARWVHQDETAEG